MVRGSTPTFTFTIPFDVSLIEKLYVTLEQKVDEQTIQVEKSKEQCSLEGNQIKCTLTQEDTLKLIEFRNALVQLRILTVDNNSLVSKTYKVSVSELLKEGVI